MIINEILMHYARVNALEEAREVYEKSLPSDQEEIPERPSGESDEQDDSVIE